jgi:hypothetical protein
VTGGYEVHPPALLQGGSELSAVAEQVSAQWEALRARTAAMGDIFGDDDVGGLIGMSYQVAEEIAGECLRSVVEGLRGFGAGLGVMAERYELAEQDNLANFSNLSW